MEESQFHIRYDIEDSEIELDNLIESLQGFKSSLKIIKDFYEPEIDLKIKAKAVDKGSFVLYLGLVAVQQIVQLNALFSQTGLSLPAAIISSLSHTLNIKKHLGGKKPKSVTPVETKGSMQVNIENNNGVVLVVNNADYDLLEKTGLDKALTQAVQVVEKEPSLRTIELYDEHDNKLVEAPRAELLPIASPEEEEVVESKREVVKKDVPVNTLQLNWEKKNKWKFIYLGNPITAKISDEDFYDKIDSGERFAKGDTLRVDLKIKQEFDKGANTFINKAYEVVRVLKHNPRGEQGQLNFE